MNILTEQRGRIRRRRRARRPLHFESLERRQLLAAVAGDFDGNGCDDLVISNYYRHFGGAFNAGAVMVSYGSRSGLTSRIKTGNSWTQDTPGVKDTAETGDGFGYALAAGDFDNDSYDDLVVSAPYEDVGAAENAGVVHIIYGSSSGLSTRDQLFHQGISGVDDLVEQNDLFGWSVATGDFNADGYDDLVIGIPGEKVNLQEYAGAAYVLYGSASGLTTTDDELFHQDAYLVDGVAEEDDMFGYSLSAGDFDRDGRDDLAIGVPGEDVGVFTDAGAVNVIYGSSAGLTSSDDQYLNQSSAGIRGQAEEGDSFGTTLATGHFNRDRYADLAVGVPGEDRAGHLNTGAVNVIYGSSDGLTNVGDQYLHQGSPGIPGTSEDNDYFGLSLAAGDLDGDRRDDLVIGVPYEDVGQLQEAGDARIVYGAAGQLGPRGERIYQNLPKVDAAAEAGDRFAEYLAVGDFDADGRDDLAVNLAHEYFGEVHAPTATHVFYCNGSQVGNRRSEMWVAAKRTQAGFRLTKPQDDEDEEKVPADMPNQVAGMFLKDFYPERWAVRAAEDREAYSYNDIFQGKSSTCAFAAALSAVARTDFNFASRIKLVRAVNAGYRYAVKLYQNTGGGYTATWQRVWYGGVPGDGDLQISRADSDEFWTTLYLRAYLDLFQGHPRLKNSGFAMSAITGKGYRSYDPNDYSKDTNYQHIHDALGIGRPVTAGTIGANKTNLGAGLISDHGYVILAIKSAAQTLVTLYNPWGKDNNLSPSQYNDGWSPGELFEGKFVDGQRNDGIIRITWQTFKQYFERYYLGKV